MFVIITVERGSFSDLSLMIFSTVIIFLKYIMVVVGLQKRAIRDLVLFLKHQSKNNFEDRKRKPGTWEAYCISQTSSSSD